MSPAVARAPWPERRRAPARRGAGAAEQMGEARMADETLKRLLNAEMEAERIVTRADEERQAIIEQAKRDARAEQQQYADRIADLRASFRAQAEQRAQQTITAMQRRFQEQELALRSSAKLHEQLAVDEALAVIIGMQK